jgi:hypothetical protein
MKAYLNAGAYYENDKHLIFKKCFYVTVEPTWDTVAEIEQVSSTGGIVVYRIVAEYKESKVSLERLLECQDIIWRTGGQSWQDLSRYCKFIPFKGVIVNIRDRCLAKINMDKYTKKYLKAKRK